VELRINGRAPASRKGEKRGSSPLPPDFPQDTEKKELNILPERKTPRGEIRESRPTRKSFFQHGEEMVLFLVRPRVVSPLGTRLGWRPGIVKSP